ncbi:MAG: hydrogenase iron-sulfur subunit [Candidatus Korarchaeota archaeon]
MSTEKSKIGVFICHCGGNISDVIDVEKVKEEISKIEGVKICITHEYVCSDPGQEQIVKAIRNGEIDRVVIAACTPNMHINTFRRTLISAGLNPYLLEIANIREQCSWVHEDKDLATLKAIDLVRGAVERARYLVPLTPFKIQVIRDVLVVGGGIAGIIASIELAEKGFRVYLLERGPSIGGHMAQFTKTFPTLDCSQCILTPKMVQVAQASNVKIITMAEIDKVDGSPGRYRVLIRKKPRYVDASKCVACGECEKICPAKAPNEYEAYILYRKAIYQPFKQAIPRAYVIDDKCCLYINKGVCRLCEKICKANAIDFNQKEELLELNVGAIVVCTGFDLLDPSLLDEYGFGRTPDIVSNLQFERILAHGMQRPSDGKVPKKIAFVLCVGSRSRNKENCVQHCCKIGCMIAIKQALIAKKISPNTDAWIFYTDVRADGKGYEEFYVKAQEEGIHFIRGSVSEICPTKDGILIKAEDTALGIGVEEKFDLVVLSPAIIPSPGASDLARKLKLQLGTDGFFMERHYKLSPVDSPREGIFIAGCALGPKDIRETTLEASAAASRATTFLGKGEIEASPEVAQIIGERCDNCGACISVCPVMAIEKKSSGLMVDVLSCIGCGLCVSTCPRGAVDLLNSTEKQLLAQIRGIAESGVKPKIIAFLERQTAYGSADLAGLFRMTYPPNVEIIRVPTIGRIGIKHVLYAFAMGADGVMLVEDEGGVLSEKIYRDHVNSIRDKLQKYGLHFRFSAISTTLPQYDKLVNALSAMVSRISRMGPLSEDLRLQLRQSLKMMDTLEA